MEYVPHYPALHYKYPRFVVVHILANQQKILKGAETSKMEK